MMTEDFIYQVKVDVFEGPFDVLLKAIDDGEINVHLVSISQITASYFDYWKREMPNLLQACDFLYMAAYLFELKSRSILPAREENPENENLLEVEESLLNHMQEFQIYKKLAQDLKQRKEIYSRIYGRHEGEKQEKDIQLVEVSLRDLVLAFRRVYAEASQREKIISIPENEVSLEDRIAEIKQLLSDAREGVPFENLFFRRTRLEIIVTFLAVLELAKQRNISIRQGNHFGEILIFGCVQNNKQEEEVVIVSDGNTAD